jgi:hypothetical protein
MYVSFLSLLKRFNWTDFNLVYLLHAYDYSPEDPLICLSLAIASIGRAMQRQSDNRHLLITQVRFRAARKNKLTNPLYLHHRAWPSCPAIVLFKNRRRKPLMRSNSILGEHFNN